MGLRSTDPGWRRLLFWRRGDPRLEVLVEPEPAPPAKVLEAKELECAYLRAENRRLTRRLETDGQAFDMKMIETGDMFIAQQGEIRAKDREIAQLRTALRRTQTILRESMTGESTTSLAFRLKRSMMHAAGLTAQLELMHETHPDSPLLEMADECFEDGRPKTRLRLAYEAAFDAYGAEHQITEPQALRRR